MRVIAQLAGVNCFLISNTSFLFIYSFLFKYSDLVVKVKEATKRGYAEAHLGDSVNLSAIGSKTRRGRVGNGVANTLDTGCNQGIFVKVSEELTVYAIWYEKYQCYIAIRYASKRMFPSPGMVR